MENLSTDVNKIKEKSNEHNIKKPSKDFFYYFERCIQVTSVCNFYYID